MTQTTDAQLRQLLLQRLAPEEQLRVEDAILLEEGVAERLRAEELDLLDDFAKDRLTAAERHVVRSSLLATPDGVESLRVARGLRELSRFGSLAQPATQPPGRSRAAQVSVWGGLLVAGVAAVIWAPRWVVTPPALRPVPSAPVPDATQPPTQSASAQIITLLTDRDRGRAAAPVLRLSPTASMVRLQTEIPWAPSEATFNLQIADLTGQQQFAAVGLAARIAGPYRFVEVLLPRAALGPGDRSISLRTAGAAAREYRWQVSSVMADPAPQK